MEDKQRHAGLTRRGSAVYRKCLHKKPVLPLHSPLFPPQLKGISNVVLHRNLSTLQTEASLTITLLLVLFRLPCTPFPLSQFQLQLFSGQNRSGLTSFVTHPVTSTQDLSAQVAHRYHFRRFVARQIRV
jgi:hypothetical protein